MWSSRDLPARFAAAALDRVGDAVLITEACPDAPGPRIVYANRAFSDMTGYADDELVGATPRILQGPNTDRGVLDRLRAALEGGECFSGELVNYRRDGSEFQLELALAPLRDAQGCVTHFVASMRDITLPRQHRRRRTELEALARVQRDLAGAGGLNLDAVRQRIAEAAMEATGADGAVVEEPEGGDLVYRAVAGSAAGHLGLRIPKGDSLSGACYRELRVIVCHDTARDERVAAEAARAVGFASGVLVPLVQGYRCFGVLKVFAAEPGRFGHRERDFLELASGMLAGALETAHTYHAEVSRRGLLLDSLPMLVAYVDRDGRYREVNAAYERWFGVTQERLVGREMRCVLGEDGYAPIEPYVNAVLRGEAVHYETSVTAPSGDVRYLQGDYTPDLDRNGRQRGFFAVARDVTGLQTLYTDYLTEIHNRRKLEEQGATLIEAARRYGRPLSLVMMDVDHFKSINDDHGHPAGDAVLRMLARVLQDEVRAADLLARWGGEEFAIVAPETTEADAAAFAERIRARIAGHEFVPVGPVTASFGVATLDTGAEDMGALQARADAALYRAKRAGRNRVVCHAHDDQAMDATADERNM